MSVSQRLRVNLKVKINILTVMMALALILVVVTLPKVTQALQCKETYSTVGIFFYMNNNTHDERIYHKRNKLIQQTCHKYGIPTKLGEIIQNDKSGLNMYQKQWLQYEQYKNNTKIIPILHDEKHSLCYCWLYKVASSSWMTLFYNIKGKQVTTSKAHRAMVDLMMSRNNFKNVFADNTTLTFFFSRHPFDRLISAYVSKIELAPKDSVVYKRYVSTILKVNSVEDMSVRPSFKQFVTYILGLTDMSAFNPHWIPQWLHCNVCQWRFQVPGHMETIGEDSMFIAQRAGLNISMPWAYSTKIGHKGQNRSHQAKDTDLNSSTTAYLKELEVDQLKRLHELYLMDFEMFGYSSDTCYD